jgi:acetyltransferase
VVKLYSRTITHKTDVGGVQLNLTDEAAVRAAFDEINVAVTERRGAEHFEGVTVQPMINYTGYELIVGSSTDAQFGPVLLFGSGGQLVELYRDRALALPPLNSTLARRMIERTKIAGAFKGIRGRRPSIRPPRAAPGALQLAGRRAAAHRRDRYQSAARFARAVDRARRTHRAPSTRGRRCPAAQAGHQAVPAAIRRRLDRARRLALPDPTDTAGGRTAARALPRTIDDGYRLFALLRAPGPLGTDRARAPDAGVLQRLRPRDRPGRRGADDAGGKRIVAVGRLSKEHASPEAEFSLLVGDPWQGKGLGSELLRRLVQIGRDEGLELIWADMLASNNGMRRTAQAVGFTLHDRPGDATTRAELRLT